MGAAVRVSEPVSGSSNGNDDCGTGFGTEDRGQRGPCRREHAGIRNTNVFETGSEPAWQEEGSPHSYLEPRPQGERRSTATL